MLAFTTLFIAIPLSIILYYLVIKKIRSTSLNYLIIFIAGAVFLIGRNLHLIFIGLEIMIIGFATIAFNNKMHQRKNKEK
jgi:hypothetical protein